MLTVLFSDLSIGQMLAVFSYLWFMIGPVEQLLNLQYAFYAADGAVTRINQLLAREDEPHYPGGVDPFAGRETVGIDIRDLSFSYGEERVLDTLNLSIAPGEKVAIVGTARRLVRAADPECDQPCAAVLAGDCGGQPVDCSPSALTLRCKVSSSLLRLAC